MAGNLFQRTAATLTVGSILYAVFALWTIEVLVIQPVTERAAQELAALIELSTKVWIELPPWTREDYKQEMRERHSLRIGPAQGELAEVLNHRAYLTRLEDALSTRFGSHHHILYDAREPGWYWVDVDLAEQVFRLGFRQSRLRQQLPTAVILLTSAGALFILISTLAMVRHVTRPLSRLFQAVQHLGRGEAFQPLPESGATELATLARQINRTEHQVRELLSNRTTLLAGISHDLRTPITRMQLELEMLDEAGDAELIDGLRADLLDLNRLIDRAMDLARGLEHQQHGHCELVETVSTVIDDYARSDTLVEYHPSPSCEIAAPAQVLRRVLGNLLDNAIAYGAGQSVEIHTQCHAQSAEIRVRDHGPGIPEDQFDAVLRPFFRLEASRSQATGGSGLGLAIVSQLCEAYGWTLTLETAPGGGLLVRLLIPRQLPEHGSSRT